MTPDSNPCPSSHSDSSPKTSKRNGRSIISRLSLHLSPKESVMPNSTASNIELQQIQTQTSNRRSILSRLNLNVSSITSKIPSSCISCKLFVRGCIVTGLFLMSFILVIMRLVEAEKCADDNLSDGIFGYLILNAALATFTKIFLLSLSLLNSTQIKISDEQIYFSKALSGVFYCSHILPVLMYDTESCEVYSLIPEKAAEYSILIPIANTILYILIAIGVTTLFYCSKSNKIVPKRFDAILWVFIRTVTIAFCVVTLAVLVAGSVLLYYLEMLVYIEFITISYYAIFTLIIAQKNKRCLFSLC